MSEQWFNENWGWKDVIFVEGESRVGEFGFIQQGTVCVLVVGREINEESSHVNYKNNVDMTDEFDQSRQREESIQSRGAYHLG